MHLVSLLISPVVLARYLALHNEYSSNRAAMSMHSRVHYASYLLSEMQRDQE